MISSSVKNQVFQGIPKSVILDGTQYDAWIDYSDRVNVSEKLKDYPLVVTLRYFADRRDEANSPPNQVFKKEVADQDIEYTKGERAQVTLSINVHAGDEADLPAAILIDAYLELLHVWYLRDLPEVVKVVGRGEVADLSYLEDRSERRQLDIYLRYSVTYQESSNTIETVEHTSEVQQ